MAKAREQVKNPRARVAYLLYHVLFATMYPELSPKWPRAEGIARWAELELQGYPPGSALPDYRLIARPRGLDIELREGFCPNMAYFDPSWERRNPDPEECAPAEDLLRGDARYRDVAIAVRARVADFVLALAMDQFYADGDKQSRRAAMERAFAGQVPIGLIKRACVGNKTRAARAVLRWVVAREAYRSEFEDDWYCPDSPDNKD